MIIKTEDLTGTALDWAVAKAEGINPYIVIIGSPVIVASNGCQAPMYSTDWGQGGPIIESAKLITGCVSSGTWSSCDLSGDSIQFGDTPLIAAMRCYIANKLGNEIDIPEELTK